jgi:hypothetical protein
MFSKVACEVFHFRIFAQLTLLRTSAADVSIDNAGQGQTLRDGGFKEMKLPTIAMVKRVRVKLHLRRHAKAL